jgi:predicted secreted protein
MSDVRVAAGRKIAIISHCFLNQNTKPHQRARYPGIVTPVLETIAEAGFALMQLPCPEISFAGMNRWSQVIEQYDTPAYRQHCRTLASQSIDQIEHFLRDPSFTLVIIGLEGSPSCGIKITGSSSEWRGYPGDREFDGRYPVKQGTGLFMQAIRDEIERRGLVIPPTLGVGLDLYGIDLDHIGAQLKAELQQAAAR